jgi:hypothetical protein
MPRINADFPNLGTWIAAKIAKLPTIGKCWDGKFRTLENVASVLRADLSSILSRRSSTKADGNYNAASINEELSRF